MRARAAEMLGTAAAYGPQKENRDAGTATPPIVQRSAAPQGLPQPPGHGPQQSRACRDRTVKHLPYSQDTWADR